MALDFVSPENVEECIRLAGEFRVLPQNHRAKEDKLEVSSLFVAVVSASVTATCKINCISAISIFKRSDSLLLQVKKMTIYAVEQAIKDLNPEKEKDIKVPNHTKKRPSCPKRKKRKDMKRKKLTNALG